MSFSKNYARALTVACGLSVAAVFTGCTTTRGVNQDAFKGVLDVKNKLDSVRVGMTKDEVFKALDLPEDRFQIMGTSAIKAALFGGENTQVTGNLKDLQEASEYLASLQGYRIKYEDVTKSYVYKVYETRTKQKGVDIAIAFVFGSDGRLLRKPIVDGGTIDLNNRKPAVEAEDIRPFSLISR